MPVRIGRECIITKRTLNVIFFLENNRLNVVLARDEVTHFKLKLLSRLASEKCNPKTIRSHRLSYCTHTINILHQDFFFLAFNADLWFTIQPNFFDCDDMHAVFNLNKPLHDVTAEHGCTKLSKIHAQNKNFGRRIFSCHLYFTRCRIFRKGQKWTIQQSTTLYRATSYFLVFKHATNTVFCFLTNCTSTFLMN